MSFPLDGYFRPGKYFPVQLNITGEPPGMLHLAAAGAVATEAPVGGRDQSLIVPMLAITPSLTELHVFPPSGHSPAHISNLIALTEDDRLVATIGVNQALAYQLFPGKNILFPAHLETSAPLFSPLAAWQSLDGIVLDPATAAHITQRQLAGLLAAGTVLAIEGGPRPTGPHGAESPWHWTHVGTLWIASRPDAGPDDVMQQDAYLPSEGWQVGFDALTRWRVFVAAALFSAILLGLLLLRPRGMTPIAVAVAAIAVAAAMFWHSRQITGQELHGSVFVRGGLTVLHDRWSYHAVIRPETVEQPFDHLLRPVFGYDRQPAQTQMRLQCDDRGNPVRFIYLQQPRTMLAFFSRTVEPGFGNFKPDRSLDSRMKQMADELYVDPTDRPAGQIPAPSGDDWPAVVITAPARPFDSE